MDGKSVVDNWEKEIDKKVKDSITAQCFPLFSILLAIGNPTVSVFFQEINYSLVLTRRFINVHKRNQNYFPGALL